MFFIVIISIWIVDTRSRGIPLIKWMVDTKSKGYMLPRMWIFNDIVKEKVSNSHIFHMNFLNRTVEIEKKMFILVAIVLLNLSHLALTRM